MDTINKKIPKNPEGFHNKIQQTDVVISTE